MFWKALRFKYIFKPSIDIETVKSNFIEKIVTCKTRRSDGKRLRVLDVGCSFGRYRSIFDDDSIWEYIGCDYPQSTPDHPVDIKKPNVWADLHNLPFKTHKFDLIICTEVLEHCAYDRQCFSEIVRIMTIGAGAIISVPMTYRHHNIPWDFRRYTIFGLQNELKLCGLKVKNLIPTSLNSLHTLWFLGISIIPASNNFLSRVSYYLFKFAFSVFMRISIKLMPHENWEFGLVAGHIVYACSVESEDISKEEKYMNKFPSKE